jgi:diguanylate cyclase (GGDEF)-like protein
MMDQPDAAGEAPPDLTECDREPIHIPGHIQPHGVLIATFPNSRRISHLSANFDVSCGLSGPALLGADIDRVFGPALAATIKDLAGPETLAPFNVLNLTLPIPIHPRRKVVLHNCTGRTIVELEDAPLVTESGVSVSRAQGIITGLRRTETMAQLCHAAAREIRQLTGYDRVMIYRFGEHGDGSVVAEDKQPGLEPFLNLHYPGSDIPLQARRLYVQQRVRSIPDVDYRPAPLLSAAEAAEGAALDMTYCSLRGVSPVHLEYLRNMGVKATLTVSLLQDTTLWGMVACHHMVPMAASADMRALCDVIGQLMSVLLQKVSDAEELAGGLRRYHIIAGIANGIEEAKSVAEGLLRQGDFLLDLMGADGALIRCGGSTSLIGECPPVAAASAIVAAMCHQHGEAITGISDAGCAGGPAAACAAAASGILLMPITHHPGDAVAWFRSEMLHKVRWAGDPNKSVVRDPDTARLSPRKSFAAWSQLVSGHSAPWTATDLQAAHELRRALTVALLRQTEAQLAQLSAFDPLTGLGNRRTFESHLERWRIQAEHDSAALLFVDIDRFKAINEALGHETGDDMLMQVAARLRHLAPAGSVACRLGSDEFVLFWPGVHAKEAETLGQVLVQELARPFMLRGSRHYSGASIGISCGRIGSSDLLLREADAAMYAAKREGGGRAVLYRPSQHAAVLTNIQTEQDLFRAIENNELEVHYQPVATVPARVVSGFEALLRWHHPDRGWIPPAEFIPRAEESGLIKRIGAWVLTMAVRQVAAWRMLRGCLTVAVNVSVQQLTETSLSTFLADLLAVEHVPAAAICIEVTESALMQEAAVRELQLIHAMGVAVAVDDFGTGYSSLSYLASLPVDTVKIDRSFVSPLGSSPKADRLFGAIVELAHTIDLKVVAEGCETKEQWGVIAAARCEAVQGWIVAPALDHAAATAFLIDGLPTAA